MANPKSMIHDIPLNNKDLNLSTFKGKVKQWEGYNDLNSPYLGDSLSNIYIQKLGIEGGLTKYITYDGRVLSIKDGILYEDDTPIMESKGKWIKSKKLDWKTAPTGTIWLGDHGLRVYVNNSGAVVVTYGDATADVIVTDKPTTKSCIAATKVIGDSLFIYLVTDCIFYLFEGSISDNTKLELKSRLRRYGSYIVDGVYVARAASNNGIYVLDNGDAVISGLDSNGCMWGFSMEHDYGVTDVEPERAGGDTIPQRAEATVDGSIWTVGYLLDNQQNVHFDGRFLHYTKTSIDWRDITYDICKIKSITFTPRASPTMSDKIEINYDVEQSLKYNAGRQSGSFFEPTWNKQTKTYSDYYSSLYCTIAEYQDYYTGSTSYNNSGVIFGMTFDNTGKYCGFNGGISGDWNKTVKPGAFNRDRKGFISGGGIKNIFYTTGWHVDLNDNFRLLYNGGELSGISVISDHDSRGSIVALLDVETVCILNENEIAFRKRDNTWYKVTVSTDPKDAVMQAVGNRAIIMNTVITNCYDFTTKRVLFAGDDWNNRHILRHSYLEYTVLNDRHSTQSGSVFTTYYDFVANGKMTQSWESVSSVNNKLDAPTLTASMQWPPSGICYLADGTVYNLYPEYKLEILRNAVKAPGVDAPVDLFTGYQEWPYSNSGGYYIGYKCSVDANGNVLNKETIEQMNGSPYISWVTENGTVLFPVPVTASFDTNYSGNVTFRYAGNLYEMVTNENPFFVFYNLTVADIDSDNNAPTNFNIQGQSYLIRDGKIYPYSTSEGVSIVGDDVCNVSGLVLIASTPFQAYFWSKTLRSLFSFTGDRLLTYISELNTVEQVIGAVYDPASNSVAMLTDKYVLIVSDNFIYKIPETANTIFLTDGGFSYKTDESVTRVKYFLSDVDVDYVKQPVKVETAYYGVGDSTVSVTDCLYVRVFDDKKESGKVKITSYTLLNDTTISDEQTFNITNSMWDDITSTYYLRYQPPHQRAIGVSFKIESDFPITSISVGNTVDTMLLNKAPNTDF